MLLYSFAASSCQESDELFGVPLDEFRSGFSQGGLEFLLALPLDDERNLEQAERVYSGAVFFTAEACMQAGLSDEAKRLYAWVSLDRDNPRSLDALRELGRLQLADFEFDQLLNGRNAPGDARAPSPERYDWYYAQRFEALLQTERFDQARRELEILRARYGEYVDSERYSHSLLYYQALIGARFIEQQGGRELVEPYIYVSDARSGHFQLYSLIESEHQRIYGEEGTEQILPGDSDSDQLLVWIENAMELIQAKTLTLEGSSSQALDIFLSRLPDSFDRVYRFTTMRIDEGMFRDVFTAARNGASYDLGIEFFERALASIPGDLEGAERVNLRLREYLGRLLLDSGRSFQAARVFEDAFLELEKHQLSSSDPNSSERLQPGEESVGVRAYNNARSEQVQQERLLWYWIQALMRSIEEGGSADLGDLIRAYGWVRNPDYFRDITREFASELLASDSLDVVYAWTVGVGDRMPYQWRVFLLHSMYERASQRRQAVSSDDLLRRMNLAHADGPGHSVDALLGERPGELDVQDLLHVLPLTRSLSSVDAGKAPISLQAQQELHDWLTGYADFGLYSRAADMLSAAGPEARVDADQILGIVHAAYEQESWYEGLRILETALYRSRLYGDNLEEYIRASGSAKELARLLYPRAFHKSVQNSASEYNMPAALVYALLREESRFDAKAGSHAGAQGLGQIVPATGDDIARRMRLEQYDLHDAETNIRMSAYYLSYLSGRFSTFPEVLAAYNAGQGRVDRWNRLPHVRGYSASSFIVSLPFEETRDYVPRVIDSWMMYDRLYGSGQGAEVADALAALVVPFQRN